MQNGLWNASLKLGLIVLASAGLMIGTEIVGVSVRPGFAQEEQQEQQFTRQLSEESGRLEDGSYYDVYTLEAQAGQSFLIEMVSDAFDTYLMVFDAEGNKLAENNDGENGTNAQLAITIPAMGQYETIANSFQAGATGEYTLIVRANRVETISQMTNQSNLQAEAERLLNLGIEQFNRSQFQDAIASWQSALELYQSIADTQGEARSLGYLGEAYRHLEQYWEAIAYYEQSLELSRVIEDVQWEASSLGNLGIAYDSLGQHREAIVYYEQSLAIFRAIADVHREVRVLGYLGETYANLSQYREAVAYYEQSLEIARATEDRQGESNALLNLGNASLYLGEYREAIAYYEQSLEIARVIADQDGESSILNNLGEAYRNLGEYRRAIACYEQSLEIARVIADQDGEASTLGNLGEAYRNLGEYRRAIAYYEESLEIARAIADQRIAASALTGLGLASDFFGNYQEAIAYHEQALEISRAIADRLREGYALNNLGNIYFFLRNYREAIAYHEQALEVSRAIENRQGEAYALNNLGLSFLYTQQYADAERLLSEAVVVYETLRDSELPDTSKVSFLETHIRSYMLLQQALIAQNKTNPALEIAERSRARALVELLSDRVSERTAAEITIGIPSVAEIQRIAQQQNATLVSYYIIDFQDGDDPVLYIWIIQPSGEISFQSVDLSSLNTPISDLVALSRSNLGVRSRNDGNIISVLPPEELQRQREQQRQSLNDLYNILVAPISESLPTNESDRIIFIPQGELFLVPFAALVDNNDQYLIENHTLSIAPSIQTLALTRQLQNPNVSLTDNPLIVGNPTMPRLWNPETNTEERLPYLEGAENEAVAIAQQLNTEALLWDNASETLVAQQMQNASLIHLATHGLLDYGTPEETGIRDVPGAIALAPDSTNDGLLTSAEILAMGLQANLVVLSACDTGRGTITGDGVIGLSRSLMQAGVPSVVVSLWSVPDDSTEFLMKEFYANLDEMDKAQALRQAMLTTMQQSDYATPLDWAAFTLIGEAN